MRFVFQESHKSFYSFLFRVEIGNIIIIRLTKCRRQSFLPLFIAKDRIDA